MFTYTYIKKETKLTNSKASEKVTQKTEKKNEKKTEHQYYKDLWDM